MDTAMMTPADVWLMISENPFSSAVFIALIISEALASIQAVKANSVYQLVVGFLKKFAPQPKV